MILIDASILIRYHRRPDPVVRVLLARPDIAVCGVTRAELLHGARTPVEVSTITATLDAFIQVSIPDVIWSALGLNLSSLSRAGITVPFQDVLLATVAIHNGVELWSSDAQFGMIQTILPALSLFVAPAPPAPTVTP